MSIKPIILHVLKSQNSPDLFRKNGSEKYDALKLINCAKAVLSADGFVGKKELSPDEKVNLYQNLSTLKGALERAETEADEASSGLRGLANRIGNFFNGFFGASLSSQLRDLSKKLGHILEQVEHIRAPMFGPNPDFDQVSLVPEDLQD